MSVAVEHAGIDYHVVLAQNALQQCLEVVELQDELVTCLAKQTTPHTHTKIGVQVTPMSIRRKNSPKPARDCASPKLRDSVAKHSKLKNVSQGDARKTLFMLFV